MTSYNREKYIGAAIQSVLASDCENWELIVVDDGSTDSTVSIARSFEKMDARVRVYINEKNLGDYPNRNQAAAYARGKYIKYVDADDYIYPWGIRILLELMEQFPEAGWGLCSMPPNKKMPYPVVFEPLQAYREHYLGNGLFFKAPLSAIIKKETFDAVGGFSNIRMAGDFEMWHRLALEYPVVVMPQGIVWYRVHDAQEMNHHKKYLSKYEEIKKKYLLSDKCPLPEHEVQYILKRSRKRAIKELYKAVMRLSFDDINLRLKLLQHYK